MSSFFKKKQNHQIKKQMMFILAIAIGLLLFFQNCAPANNSSENSSIVGFPTIQSVEPRQNARVVDGVLLCAGDCLITFKDTSGMTIGNISCGGNLTISGNQLRCDNDLTMSP